MTIKLNPITFNEFSPGRHEDNIDDEVLEKEEILNCEEKPTVDKDSVVFIGEDRAICNKDGCPNVPVGSQRTNKNSGASEVL